MGAILPTHLWHVYQPKVDLVHQSRGLQRVIWLFAAHVAAREPVQFVMHQRNQPTQGAIIALTPGFQKLSYFDS